jgi:small subunit ribosomal protein S2
MLTNWRTIRQRIEELERMEKMQARGDFERITKKEAQIMIHEMERLEMLLGGIRHMNGLPDLLFVVDVKREETAIHEANLLKIPVLAMVDTNCNPGEIDYVIPSNDDAIRAIKLLVGKIADAAIEGAGMRKDEVEEMPAEPMLGRSPQIEDELDDADLLGEATLRKISGRPLAETMVDEEAEVAAPVADDETPAADAAADTNE